MKSYEKIINTILKRQKAFFSDGKNISSTVLGLCVFVASLIINYGAGNYTMRNIGTPVRDIILDNIPVIHTSFIFIHGAIALWIFVLFLLIWDPNRIAFTLRSVSLLIIIRSFFVIMTHLGPYPERAFLPHYKIMSLFTFGADFFFSGHTAFPFLFALIFWPNKKLRCFFLLSSLVFAASVLLGHLHYSIDVFAAFFITYSTYILSARLFSREFETLYGEKPKFIHKF